MSRYDELFELVNKDIRYQELIKDAVFLEDQCDSLRQLPFVVVNKKNKSIQRATPAAKLYKECLAQYSNIVRILARATDDDSGEEDSPLRKWMNEHNQG